MHRGDDQVAGLPLQLMLSARLQELHPRATPVVGRSQELAPEAEHSAVIACCTHLGIAA